MSYEEYEALIYREARYAKLAEDIKTAITRGLNGCVLPDNWPGIWYIVKEVMKVVT